MLFIKLFQPISQFRNPFTFYYSQTFPLPPKSTILGFLQNACQRYYDEVFDSLKISIWGYSSAIYWNYSHFIKGKIILDDKGILRVDENNGDRLSVYGLNRAQRSPTYQQEILGLNLFIFIKGNEEILGEIEEKIKRPIKILNLGRGEDVVFIREIRKLSEENDFRRRKLIDFRVNIGTYLIKNSNILSESTFSTLPVYYITTKNYFFVIDDGRKERIRDFFELLRIRDKAISELLRNRNRARRNPKFSDKFIRDAEFSSVFYVDNTSVLLNSKTEALIYELEDSRLGRLKFYLIEDLSWI